MSEILVIIMYFLNQGGSKLGCKRGPIFGCNFYQGIENGQFIDVAPDILAEAVYGIVIGPMKSLPLESYKKQTLEKIRQDVLRLVNRMIIV